ncbi:MAG: hypothetical protein GF341_13025 [candidate division Zixibacteria bacterium]|nr:hypothetical protein [candidate division Zixibacteria bacterium]
MRFIRITLVCALLGVALGIGCLWPQPLAAQTTINPDISLIGTAVIYAVIGWLHWLWRRPLWTITDDVDQARRDGLPIRLWDFLFYGTFAVVVTSSVKIVGVLLVFSLLVVPGAAAILILNGRVGRLVFGWVFGLVVCVLGMVISFYADLPPGATIVTAFGAALVLTWLVSLTKRRA